MRLGDLDDLKVHISELILVYSGTELDNAILNAIDNALTFDVTKNQAYDQGFITAMRLYSRPQGEWGEHGECPFCSYIRKWKDDKFCGNCGAEMGKEVKKNETQIKN